MAGKGSTSRPARGSPGSASLRRQLVEHLEHNASLTSSAVRKAFLAVPRERFLAETHEREGLERIYEDRAIVTVHDDRGNPTSSSSQPSIMASMLEHLDLRPGQRVLEVGAGTGYNAALLEKLVGSGGRVVSIELDPTCARGARRALASAGSRAKVVRGDGRAGWPRGAPYDRMIVTASTAIVPRAWCDQLAEGGLLELPLRIGQFQAVVTLRKHGQVLRSEALVPGSFMALRDAPGARAAPPAPRLGAIERMGERSRSLAQLHGEALRCLSPARRQRLLSLALSEPHTEALGLRAPRAALGLYLTLEAPEDRLVSSWPGIGVISENAGGLALLTGGPKTFTRIDTYGDHTAQRLLRELVEGWKGHGRPDSQHLRIDASFRGRVRAHVRWTWDS